MGSLGVTPFTAYNFAVEIHVPFIGKGSLCNAAFSECDGLDMTMDIKTLREGGNNTQQIRMLGPVTYGQLTLKRGMTANFDLWDWFDGVQHATAKQMRTEMRGDVDVVVFPADHKKEVVRFLLKKCLPTKIKAPALNAKDGMVAIEELQISYESMTLKIPDGGKG